MVGWGSWVFMVVRAQYGLLWGKQLWQPVKTLGWGQEPEATPPNLLGACPACLSGGEQMQGFGEGAGGRAQGHLLGPSPRA